MCCGQTNVQFSWKGIGGFVAGSRENDPGTNQGKLGLSYMYVRMYMYMFVVYYLTVFPPSSYRPKHPVKVHVWAGISMRGATGICIFEGTMDADHYIEILRQTLLPFLPMWCLCVGSCKITTQNILPGKCSSFLTPNRSIGGKHHQNRQTATRSNPSKNYRTQR